MTKKAQANQIFMYIVAVLVLGLIVLIGYVAVSKIIPQMCETSKVTFEKNLQQTLKESKDFGTIKNQQLQLPCDYEGLCFISTTVQNPHTLDPPVTEPYEAELQDYVDAGTAVNAFYITPKGRLEEISVYQQEKAPVIMEGANDYICIVPSTNILNLKLRGQGRTVMVSS